MTKSWLGPGYEAGVGYAHVGHSGLAELEQLHVELNSDSSEHLYNSDKDVARPNVHMQWSMMWSILLIATNCNFIFGTQYIIIEFLWG